MKKHLLLFLILGIVIISSCNTDPKTPLEENPIIVNPAITELNEKIKFNPNDPELYLSRASVYGGLAMYDEAIVDMKKALSFDSSSIAYRHVLADFYVEAEQDSLAISLLKETITLFPASIRTILRLSEFQYILDKNEDALSTVDQLMEVAPDTIEGYYMYGRIYAQMGDETQAVKNFEKALSINSKHFDSLLDLGTFYNDKKSKKALPFLSKALKLFPENPDIVFEMGNYYRFQGDDKKALEHYKQVTLIDNQYTDAHINAGLIHLDKKSYLKANNFFNIAVETDPTYPSAYYYRGVSYAFQGEKGKAKADLLTALDLAPSYKEAQDFLNDLED